MRILVFTGKGGVGKTSIAAATALKCAKMGYRTVVISVDPSHSLSDSLDLALTGRLQKIAENLWGQEIDVQIELKRHWGEVKDYLTELFGFLGMEEAIAEEVAIFPGFEEAASLLNIEMYERSGIYDVLVADTAPTSTTLRLLSFPEVMKWYMDKVFGLERRVMKVVRPVVKMVTDAPLPTDAVMGSIKDLHNRILRVREILADPARSSTRLVLNPEKMVIKETQRALTYLSLFGYPVDAAIVNKVLPDEATTDYFKDWRKTQAAYLEMVEESFSPLPILKARYFEKEVVGMGNLERLGNDIYGEKGDPTTVFMKEKPIKIFKEGGLYKLSLYLPFASKGDLDIHTRSDELIIQTKGWKRLFSLPPAMVGLNPAKAEFKGGRLEITFEEAPTEEEREDAGI